MERRVFIAVLLSFAVLYGYQALFVPPATKTATPGSTTTPAPGTNASTPAGTPGTSSQPASPAPEPAAAAVDTVVSEPSAREIVVETDDAEIVLSNQGA